MAFGKTAVSMLKELKGNVWLPPYNHKGMRQVVKEVEELNKVVFHVLRANDYKVTDNRIACGLITHHQSLERNKRCALAYLDARIRKVCNLWWETGFFVPQEIKTVLSPEEQTFFQDYDKLVSEYMGDVGGLELSSDQRPPTELFVEVRCLQDAGELMTDEGPVTLRAHEQYLLPRKDVDRLIRKGVLALVDAEK